MKNAADDVIDLLNGWSLKGNIKGDVIKRFDPHLGPLSDVELQMFNEGAVRAFEAHSISLTELAIGLVISSTGRRPIQISHLRRKDILKGKNIRGDDAYFLNTPRAKQRATRFREEFKQFAITLELWTILTSQADIALKTVEKTIGFELQTSDRLELPLFPNMETVIEITSPQLFKAACKTDRLHIKTSYVTKTCKKIAEVAELKSERTGDQLNTPSVRFRRTTGTRAAREGFGKMIIAELLDHSDNQNASVYIENIPEHVESLDKAVGHQMARYAQAFSGVVVDKEEYAERGDDLSSRIRNENEGIGTCGSYGFCGANVPIPCYTCMHFQPWLHGPHEAVYEQLITERQRVQEITGDPLIASTNDLSIAAVADVIQRCAARKEEMKNG